MADCDNLFKQFNSDLQVLKTKKESIAISDGLLRDKIREHFAEKHPKYKPKFFQQGSSKLKNRIRTKDDTCDLDDGVYFEDNPEDVTGSTLQGWVYDAVTGITDSTPTHRKKCITVDYKAGYNIDLPVLIFDQTKDSHPKLAVKDEPFKPDDPREFIQEFKRVKDSEGQLIRITRFLKAWCDYKRQKMPSGLAMTVLAMKNWVKNKRDDISLKFTLIAIQNELNREFKCIMPTTPHDNLFASYDEQRKNNFLDNLTEFIKDAKCAVDEENNQLKASRLWRKHFGNAYFPEGDDKNEVPLSSASLLSIIGSAKPYYGL